MPQAATIKTMFNRVSKSYDILNDILSLGIHRLWKKSLINEALKDSPQSLLDCATGTGDIAIWAKEQNPQVAITGIDFSPGMLEIAKSKTSDIDWQVADIMNLQMSDNQFECTTISYGIRNVENLDKGLQELSRVTRKKLCILEFGAPTNKIFAAIYFGFMDVFMPLLGLCFGKKSDYKYLVDSSKKFPSGAQFVQIMQQNTSFTDITYRPYFGGITYLYTAQNKQ